MNLPDAGPLARNELAVGAGDWQRTARVAEACAPSPAGRAGAPGSPAHAPAYLNLCARYLQFLAPMNEQQSDELIFVLSHRCVECDRRWDDATERWRIYSTCDEPPEPVTY